MEPERYWVIHTMSGLQFEVSEKHAAECNAAVDNGTTRMFRCEDIFGVPVRVRPLYVDGIWESTPGARARAAVVEEREERAAAEAIKEAYPSYL